MLLLFGQLYLVRIQVKPQLLLDKFLLATTAALLLHRRLIWRCWLSALGQPLLHDEAAFLPALYWLVGVIRGVTSVLLRHCNADSAHSALGVDFSVRLLLTVWGRLLVRAWAWATDAYWGLEGVQVDLLGLTVRLEGWLGCSIGIKTLAYRLLETRCRGFSSLGNYLFGFLLLRVYWLSLLSADKSTSALILPHFRWHHILYVFVWMKVVVHLILVETNLHLVKFVKALSISKLSLTLHHFLGLISIIACASLHFIYSGKLHLRLWNLSIRVLLEDIVCLRRTVFFQQELLQIIVVHFHFLVLLETMERIEILNSLVVAQLSLAISVCLLAQFLRIYRVLTSFGEIAGHLGWGQLGGALGLHVRQACKCCVFVGTLVEAMTCVRSHVVDVVTPGCFLTLSFIWYYLSLLLLRFQCSLFTLVQLLTTLIMNPIILWKSSRGQVMSRHLMLYSSNMCMARSRMPH